MSNLIKNTGDHSPTLYSSQFDAHYHSIHGALTETNVVFIDAGLNYVSQYKSDINVLESGFGTGLNCFATLQNSIQTNIKINYTTIEKYPVEVSIAQDYIKNLSLNESLSELYNKLHSSAWDQTISILDNFKLLKLNQDFFEIKEKNEFDLIYFDAFAPETQPELWTVEMFELMAGCLVHGGVLTTYCAKGYVKRNLKVAGFEVEALPGPPGKREITRAIKK